MFKDDAKELMSIFSSLRKKKIVHEYKKFRSMFLKKRSLCICHYSYFGIKTYLFEFYLLESFINGGFQAALPVSFVNLKLKKNPNILVCSSLINKIHNACIVSLVGMNCTVLENYLLEIAMCDRKGSLGKKRINS